MSGELILIMRTVLMYLTSFIIILIHHIIFNLNNYIYTSLYILPQFRAWAKSVRLFTRHPFPSVSLGMRVTCFNLICYFFALTSIVENQKIAQ